MLGALRQVALWAFLSLGSQGVRGAGADEAGTCDARIVVVGIDLGTTFSAIGVAIIGAESDIKVLELDGNSVLKSQINTGSKSEFLRPGTDTCVGSDGSSVYGIKRVLGRNWRETGMLRAMEQLRHFVVKDANSDTLEVRLHLKNGELMFPPEFISAAILARLRWFAEQYVKPANVTTAVITVPAYFTSTQKEATVTAAVIAGFDTPRLLTEPVAAALAFMEDHRGTKLVARDHILVFDFGGGTFDVSVLCWNGEMDLSVLAIGGDQSLGGDDLDEAIVTWIIGDKELDPKDPAFARCQLKKLAEEAKRTLSIAESHDIEVPGKLFKGGQLGEVLMLNLERQTFLKLAEPVFDRLLPIVDQVVRDAELTTDDIKHVLLVGGSSKIPKLQSMLREKFGDKVSSAVADSVAVARGATIYARSLFGRSAPRSDSGRRRKKDRPVMLSNVVPLPLGTSVCSPVKQSDAEYRKCKASFDPHSTVFSEMLPKGTKLPARGSKVVYSARTDQPHMSIDILEGGHRLQHAR